MACETVRESAQIIPVRKSTPSNLEVFVGFRTTESFKHQWCTPGGNKDAGETTAATAVRELYEECNALVWADQLELLRSTITGSRDRVYKVDSFLLDATRDDLVNFSPEEHSTMAWQDVGLIMRRHRAQLAKDTHIGTVPPRLAETLGIMEGLKNEPLVTLAEKVRASYARVVA